MNGFIYKITNDVNDKIYVGKTLLNIQKRFSQHKAESLRNKNEKRPLYRAMNKYGCEHFYIELIEECPIEILSDKEIYWINFYDSYKNGYNATLGGDGKQIYNYEAIVKEFLSGKSTKELTVEFDCCIDTIRKALHLANIDIKAVSLERYQKQLAMKNKKGETVKIFSGRKEAVEWLIKNEYAQTKDFHNISIAIGRVLNGKRKRAYDFYWEYIQPSKI